MLLKFFFVLKATQGVVLLDAPIVERTKSVRRQYAYTNIHDYTKHCSICQYIKLSIRLYENTPKESNNLCIK